MAVDGAMLSEKIDGKSELSAASVSPGLVGYSNAQQNCVRQRRFLSW